MPSHRKGHLGWLKDQVLGANRRGKERTSIQQADMVPLGLPAGDPRTPQPYLVLRENAINRV